jgi:hypothetical protein
MTDLNPLLTSVTGGSSGGSTGTTTGSNTSSTSTTGGSQPSSSNTGTSTSSTPTTTTTATGTGATTDASPQVTPGKTTTANTINVADYSGQVATDPSLALTNQETLSKNLAPIDPNAAGTNIDGTKAAYNGEPSADNAQTNQAQLQTAQQVDPRQAATYNAQTTQGNVPQATAAQGTMDPNAIVQPNSGTIDMQGEATGTNADGSINYTGQALKDFASQDLNTVDPKATVAGQIAALQSQFQGPNGEAVIPAWASATARSVAKIAAFTGMTGTAATAAMSQALLEASIPIAQSDAQFFQTLTLQNLSNQQASVINRANVLSKMDEVNADNRMAAAIQNSKNFMDLDLANLSNEQQAEIINTQDKVQSLLQDQNAVNAQRLFTATSTNDMNKFYDNLSASISQYNASQYNQMQQFNTTEANAQDRFNADLENNRQQFYSNMAYNVDVSNAKWRQTVTQANSDQQFQAAAADVKNLVGIQQEALNQIWTRSDALLQDTWTSAENQLDRDNKLAQISLQNHGAQQAATTKGIGDVLGSIAGAIVGHLF